MTRIITDEQAKYAHEHSQLVSGPAMRANLSAEWDAYIADVRAEAWEAGFEAGMCFTRELDNGNHDLELATNPYRGEDK